MSTPETDGLRVELRRLPGLTKKGLLDAPFVFQAPPLETMPRELTFNYQDYTTVSGGMHSRPESAQLEVITFETLVVDWDAPWGFHPADPVEVSKALREIILRGTPIRLIAANEALWGAVAEIDLSATLRSIRSEERAGEVDARYVGVSFTEYRSAQLIRTSKKGRVRRNDKVPSWVQVNKDGSAKDRNGHRFKSPVTLAKLAKHFYGSPGRWRLIARRNGIANYGPNHPLGEWARKHKGRDRLVIPERA